MKRKKAVWKLERWPSTKRRKLGLKEKAGVDCWVLLHGCPAEISYRRPKPDYCPYCQTHAPKEMHVAWALLNMGEPR